MYVYEFQRKAREYLLGQKLSLKSLTQKYNKEQLIKRQNAKNSSISIQQMKTEKTEQTFSDQDLTKASTMKNQKAFLIKKSPDYLQLGTEKRNHYSIYNKQQAMTRQMSIQEYVYPKPMKIVKQKLVMQTPAFKNYVIKKKLKTEENEKQITIHQQQEQQFQKYFNPNQEQHLTIQTRQEHQHKLSGWSINTNESKF